LSKQDQDKIPYKTITTREEALKLNPDYIVIASPTSYHLDTLRFLDQSLSGKTILVEKPIFEEYVDYKANNFIAVGYNLRFHPVIEFIKEIITEKNIWNVNVFCGSNLEEWRENRDYKESSSAQRKMGGGVLLDLSHEIDYVRWLFGDFNINYAHNSKVSNLEIDTDDFLHFSGHSECDTRIQVTLNYFSKLQRRNIFIDGENFCLDADLINSELRYWLNGKYNTKDFKQISRDDTFKKMHESVISKLDNFCSLEEGLEIMKLIESIRRIAS
jgi:CMP-N,N'-diacetyllegionaminic acid synthase